MASYIGADGGEATRQAIIAVNSTLDSTWQNQDTPFILKKYWGHPERYLVFDLMKIGEKVIGYAIARKDYDVHTAYLSFVAIEANSQKNENKYGTALMERTIQKIKDLQVYQYLTIECRESNTGFYEKYAARHGIGYEKDHVGWSHSGEKKYQFVYNLT